MTMDKEAFQDLFIKAIGMAMGKADGPDATASGAQVTEVEFHGVGLKGKMVSVREALDALYISGDRFYRIVDVGLKPSAGGNRVVFVRVSDHPPGTFDETWNTPRGMGPFKVLDPARPSGKVAAETT